MARISLAAKQANRVRLLECAATEFAEHGLEAANINRISLAAGLGKGTVYNYFESKEALFFAVLEAGYANFAAGALDRADASTSERLKLLLEQDCQWVREHEHFARVFLRESLNPDPKHHERYLAAMAPVTQRVVDILQAGIERGEVRADQPLPQLALVFLGLDALALLQHFASGGVWPTLEQVPELVVKQFLEGAQAPTANNQVER